MPKLWEGDEVYGGAGLFFMSKTTKNMKTKFIRCFQCLSDGTPIFETAGETKLVSRARCAETLYRGEKNPLKLMRKEGVLERCFSIELVKESL